MVMMMVMMPLLLLLLGDLERRRSIHLLRRRIERARHGHEARVTVRRERQIMGEL